MTATCEAVLAEVAKVREGGMEEVMEIEGKEFGVFERCLQLLVGLQGEGLRVAEDVVEAYKKVFPELVIVVPDPLLYAKVARIIGVKKTVDPGNKAALTQAITTSLAADYDSTQTRTLASTLTNKVLLTRLNSTGSTSPAHLHTLGPLFTQISLLESRADELHRYVTNRIASYAPNLVETLGMEAARLLLLKTKGIRELQKTDVTDIMGYQHILEGAKSYKAVGAVEKVDVIKQVAAGVVQAVTLDVLRVGKKRKVEGEEKKVVKKQRVAVIGDVEYGKMKHWWVQRKKVLQIRNSKSISAAAGEAKLQNALLRVTVSTTEYQVGMFVEWGEGVDVVIVDFGGGGVTVPISKVSNSMFTPHEVTTELQQAFAVNRTKSTMKKLQKSDDWVPEAYASNITIAKPTKPKPPQPTYPLNMLVEARGLVSAPSLNGKRGRVRGKTADRIKVAFLSTPFNEKALKPVNLTPIPPEDDPLTIHDLPIEYSQYQAASDDTLREYAARMSLTLPTCADTDTILEIITESLGLFP